MRIYEAPIRETPPGYRRAFCSICGGPLPIVHDELIIIPAGTLDDDPDIRPGGHVFVAHKAPWFEITDRLPQFKRHYEPPIGHCPIRLPAQERWEFFAEGAVRGIRLNVAADVPVLGVDVGENFLDLAIVTPDRATLTYHRVSLEGIQRPVVSSIAERIASATSIDLRGGVALVDSPRGPRDVDCSGAQMIRREGPPAGRLIDSALRELLGSASNGAMKPLSMFPTPLAKYFAGCLASAACKPHLRAIGEELLASVIQLPQTATTGSIAGGTFTRFMLSGFAVFPALDKLGIRVYESYPDLAMRLWSNGAHLPPKKFKSEATRVRVDICARVARIVGVENFQVPKTLDQTDAAILALSAVASAATGTLIELHCDAEGGFAVPFEADR